MGHILKKTAKDNIRRPASKLQEETNMGDKIDFKKRDKALYQPPRKPVLINVPEMNFLAVDGMGAPEGRDYQQAVQALYSLTFTIKMSKMGEEVPEDYFDYVVAPLEGFWWSELGSNFMKSGRDRWQWTSLIRQPEFVTPALFAWAQRQCRMKKPEISVERVRFVSLTEELCVQMMHIGPYSQEENTLSQIYRFMEENGLRYATDPGRHHHEIYLSNPQRTADHARLKTVLRVPVERSEG